jgi:glycosyltransferase involved in cell wall biosynthesis
MWTNEYKPEEHGFQVLLSVHNGEKHIRNCLESLDDSLRGHDWTLLYGDDECTDDTTVELAKYAPSLTCDKVHLFEYDRAPSVATAKNRLIEEAHNFKKRYPYVLFMDVDDIMMPERPNMAKTAIEKNSQYVVGTWKKNKLDGSHKRHLSSLAVEQLAYGPWATLFHCDFLPKDGVFFPENEICNTGFEDVLTWHHLRHIENKEATPHESQEPVHLYVERAGSVSNPVDQNRSKYNTNIFWGITNLIKNNKINIYENPPSREEAEEAMNEYVSEKEKDQINRPI